MFQNVSFKLTVLNYMEIKKRVCFQCQQSKARDQFNQSQWDKGKLSKCLLCLFTSRYIKCSELSSTGSECNVFKKSILIVGEADFSLSLSFFKLFGNDVQLVSSSFDDEQQILPRLTSDAAAFIPQGLITFRYNVDATKLSRETLQIPKDHPGFDVVVFSFPLFGQANKLDLLQQQHQLLNGFFHSAKDVMHNESEIHIYLHASEDFISQYDVICFHSCTSS